MSQKSIQSDLNWDFEQVAKAANDSDLNSLIRIILESSACQELFSLQVKQFQHDRTYHWDIQVLSIQQRINHFALHFSKYVGRLIEAQALLNVELYCKTITDFFIIALAAANAFNLNLSDEIKNSSYKELSEYKAVIKNLSAIYNCNIDNRELAVKALAIFSGRMAKACESVDHLEKYSFREVICEYIVCIAMHSIFCAGVEGMDLENTISNRLSPIKERYLFHALYSDN